MQFAVAIVAALLAAVPALAGNKAWCPGASESEVEHGCEDNRIPLSAGDRGTCCVSSKSDYLAMVNVCFYIGSKPSFGVPC
ncbi:hypothetical protein CERZMDRAFT_97245 [Cercospora zeae-maydis SCOH1-5]|uniref:Hydrophobin n=1 Tax=Cercospora zeae-maydis SCOH1-5 TaxID=717836 RepID=A0A6A6FH67_9PEZI|nr:hypothetical protein CERZMDRAFT_97245 [Cercospora zeae-maydis SCOH1-5]